MIKRRFSKPINVGAVTVGGTDPVIVQSMTNSNTRDVSATVALRKPAGDDGPGERPGTTIATDHDRRGQPESIEGSSPGRGCGREQADARRC